MRKSGPLLQSLTHRLAETPQDFVTGVGDSGGVQQGRTHVAALVNDLLSRFGGVLPDEALARFCSKGDKATQNRLALVRISVWLLADDWFAGASLTPQAVLRLLDEIVAELASTAAAAKFVLDADRREELARVVLSHLEFRPQGETEAQATDRLSAISSSERKRLVAASREAERRARQIREALARKQAEESADKWSRE